MTFTSISILTVVGSSGRAPGLSLNGGRLKYSPLNPSLFFFGNATFLFFSEVTSSGVTSLEGETASFAILVSAVARIEPVSADISRALILRYLPRSTIVPVTIASTPRTLPSLIAVAESIIVESPRFCSLGLHLETSSQQV